MKRISRLMLVLAFLLTAVAQLSHAAEGSETLEKYRASFESRMNAELDEQGKSARELRVKYIDALKNLKAELGRAENLKGAAQVVAEIEAVEDGEEAKELPADADARFQQVRAVWKRGMTEIRAAQNKKLSTTVSLYLKALDTEKRRLTRVGKIKEALLFDEEEKRVQELPEVKATLKVSQEPEVEDLQTYLEGTKWSHSVGRAAPSGVIKFLPKGKGDYTKGSVTSVSWEVTGEDTVEVSSKIWAVPLVLTFNADRSTYQGRMKTDNLKRKGRLVKGE